MKQYFLLLILILLCTIVHSPLAKLLFLILYVLWLFFGYLKTKCIKRPNIDISWHNHQPVEHDSRSKILIFWRMHKAILSNTITGSVHRLTERHSSSKIFIFWFLSRLLWAILPKLSWASLVVFVILGGRVVGLTSRKEYKFGVDQAILQEQLANHPDDRIKLVSLSGKQGLPYSYDMHLFAKGDLIKPLYATSYNKTPFAFCEALPLENLANPNFTETTKLSKPTQNNQPIENHSPSSQSRSKLALSMTLLQNTLESLFAGKNSDAIIVNQSHYETVFLTNFCAQLETQTTTAKSTKALFSARFQGIPEWVLLWITDSIPKDLYQSFLDSGLVYLVAASGGNIAFLTVLLWVLLLVIPTKVRKRAQVGGVLSYGFALRSNVALQRAVLSSLFASILSWKGRKISSTNLLLIIVVFCSLYNPYLLVTSRWFILSVAGVRGIFHIPTNLQKLAVLRNIAPAVRAFLALLGPLLLLTQKVNFLTIVASVPAWLITMIITYLSLFVLLIGGNIFWVSQLLYFCVKWLSWLTQFVATHGLYFTLEHQLFSYGIWAILWLFIRSVKKYADIVHIRD